MDSLQFELTITDLSHKGTGTGRLPNGKACFVPGTWPGDKIIVQLTQEKKRYAFGKIVKIITPSDNRTPPPCPHHGFESGKCGGCPWMLASYQSQLTQKEKKLSSALQRFNVSTDKIKKIHRSPKDLEYRNRAQLKTDGNQIGFVSYSSKELAPVDHCPVLTKHNQQLLTELTQNLPNSNWKPTGRFKWNFIEIDEECSFDSLKLNTRRVFKQGNDDQNNYMKNWLKEKFSPLSGGPTIELFCGSGNFTEILSNDSSSTIWAMEFVGEAVEILKNKNLSNVEVTEANVYHPNFWKKTASFANMAETLILDPPREGLKAKKGILDGFPKLKDILYISCDVDSFCNDLKELKEMGWSIQEIQPVDQFPHTPHLEVLCHLTRLV